MKKGFTLVELLAVIIIIGIIATITTPIVLNVISTAKAKSFEDSTTLLLKASQNYYSSQSLEETVKLPLQITFKNQNQTNTYTNAQTKKEETSTESLLKYSGTNPDSGTIKIDKDGKISMAVYNKSVGICAIKKDTDKALTFTKVSEAECGIFTETSDLINGVVTSGDGLYVDSTESNRYVYKGVTPGNYIKLGSDMYRIISIESDGTLKVIKNDSIGSMPFDPGYSTSISGVTDANSVTGTRYTSSFTDYCYYGSNGNPLSPSVETQYSGCNVWGSRTTMLDSSGNNVTSMPRTVGGDLYNLPEKEAYINTYLNKTWLNTLPTNIQSKIVTHLFNVGIISAMSYADTSLSDTLSQESTYQWKGKIGLINASDYVKANSNTELCGTLRKSSPYGDGYECMATNWLAYLSSYTITPTYNDSAGHLYSINMVTSWNLPSSISSISPVFFLSSDITLIGEGTSKNPYTIM